MTDPDDGRCAIRYGATKPDTSGHGTAVAVYVSHIDAEHAIRTLAKSGVDMRTLSIVGRDSAEEAVVGYYNAGHRMKAWGKSCALWGGLWRMLLGSALFVTPGVGPLFAAGRPSPGSWGHSKRRRSSEGMSVLGAALFSIGIPENSVFAYETQIKVGKFVVIAHGRCDEVDKGRAVLAGATLTRGRNTAAASDQGDSSVTN